MVVATHLKSVSEYENHRLIQAAILMDYISKYFKNAQRKFPAILCGDFNSPPERWTYQLVTTGKAASKFNPLLVFDMDLQLKDAFFQSEEKKPRWTTYKKRKFNEYLVNIDYIFFSEQNLELLECAEMPQTSDFPDRLPAANYPSDHVKYNDL